jgi:hypothetical protein
MKPRVASPKVNATLVLRNRGAGEQVGEAHIDLRNVDATEALIEEPVAQVQVGGQEFAEVDLRKSTLFALWSAKVAHDEAETRARLERAPKNKRSARKSHPHWPIT